MKKILIAGACLAVAMGAVAQPDVVKEAERAMKKKATPAEVIAIITPAFTNPETAGWAQTWYIPGKTMFSQYDDYIGLKAFNKLPENGVQVMCDDLLQGYDYMVKALSLDSVTQPNGKVKTKYSKDIINTLAGHINDFNAAAIDLWGLRDYKGAYRAWDIYVNLSQDQRIGKPVPDTILSEIMFNQALAAWQSEELDLALNAFFNAKNRGYNKKQLYDYAIAVAVGANNEDAVFELAQEALPLYGAEDATYMSMIINHYLNAKDFDKAAQIINDAIAAEPNNAQYRFIKGVLAEQSNDNKLAAASYREAVELDPVNAPALYNLARMLYNDAYEFDENAPMDSEEYQAYFQKNMLPLFQQAIDLFEQSYSIDNSNPDVLRYLENIYYKIGDEDKLEYTRRRMRGEED